MQIPLVLAIVAMATPAAPLSRTDPALVNAVFDGDTIVVATVGRVRLLGIDAPEIGRGFDTAAPFGREARDRLAALVLHRWVRLEREGPRLDTYNRHLAYVVREDGLFVNLEMVRQGLARVSARLPLVRLRELQTAEAEARRYRRGMWAAGPANPPESAGPLAPERPPRYTSRSDSRASKAHRKKKKP